MGVEQTSGDREMEGGGGRVIIRGIGKEGSRELIALASWGREGGGRYGGRGEERRGRGRPAGLLRVHQGEV